ncbi:MAG: nitroreductase [Desulfitibacter sp. BRH_c19]|nr:MAG: nitroreductase [Desulfitibacter sp. BRH_c19]
MNYPVKKWYNAIFTRKSRRKFLNKKISLEFMSQLKKVSTELNHTMSGARVVIVEENPDEVFKGIVGSYGKITGAPAYVAFVGDMNDQNVQEKVGYLGEALILEATSLNLATCWVGGFFKPEAVASHIKIDNHEKVLAVTPIGHVQQEYTMQEKLMSGMSSSRKRKDLNILLPKSSPENLEEWEKTAIEAARLAPSAVNRQPWRFALENNAIKVSMDNFKGTYNISKRLDCGIAMLHLELGAMYSGVKGTWDYLPDPDVAIFKVEGIVT